MHDVLAHRISLLSMHAGASSSARRAAGGDRAGRGRDPHQRAPALEDLREVIGVLRSGRGRRPLERPLPTLADLPELVEESRAAGMHVSSVPRRRRTTVRSASGATPTGSCRRG